MRPEVDAQFAEALRFPHTMVVRVEAWRDGVQLDPSLPILGGEVKLDATAKIRRQVSVEVPATDALWNLLSVPATELRPFRGIRYPGGGEVLVPLGRLEVDSQRIGYAPSGNLSVSGGDAWARVQAAEFLQPGVAEFGTLITTQIVTFLQQALPDVSVTNLVTDTWVTGAKVWETDRAGAIDEMVEALGAELAFDALGNAVLRPVPALGSTAVWTVDAGQTGVMVSADREASTQHMRNVVVVTPAAVDGEPPFAPVIVWDNNPASPTYAGPDPVNNPGGAGPFGVRVRRISSALVGSVEQATQVANAELARVSGIGRRLSLTSVVHPGLEPGDPIAVGLPGKSAEAHLVDTVTVPLTPAGVQQITTRAFGAAA